MSLAALLAGGANAAVVRVGTSSAPPSDADTGVQDPVEATVTSVTIEDDAGDAVITAEWSMDKDTGNERLFVEQGLYVGEEFISRRLMSPAFKTPAVVLRGVYELRLTFGEVIVEVPTIVAHEGGQVTYTNGWTLATHWTRRGLAGTVRISCQYRWSGTGAGPVELQFRQSDGSTVVHTVTVGSLTYPGDALYRAVEVDFDAALLTATHGELWLHASGSGSSVVIRNLIVEYLEAT